MNEKIYDVIILGGGPGSMSAGIYCKQIGLDTLLIEKGEFGGQVATTSNVSNYLGFESISGKDLSQHMHSHLTTTNIAIAQEEITTTDLSSDIKTIQTHNNKYKARAVIIGIGTAPRSLSVDNEKTYINKGISYSSLKDRDKYIDKTVAVVGGGNSALEDALYLSEKCKKVYLIHRRNEFRADKGIYDKIYQNTIPNGNIELVLECKPHSIIGDENITGINVEHIPTSNIKTLNVDCIFVAIGRGADTDIIDSNIERDNSGFIITDERMNTNIPGVYAIGDIRNTPLRQIVTAVADGAIAAVSSLTYVKSIKNK